MPDRDRNESEPDDPLAELALEYQESLRESLQVAQGAIAAGDQVALLHVAHQTRGAAGMFGYHALTETAGLLEDAIVEGQERELILELVEEFLCAIQATISAG